MSNFKDYIDVVYNTKDRPLTSYPSLLIKYLIKRYSIKINSKLLEVGCGRGEFINQFISNKIDGYAIDISEVSKKYFPNIKLKICNIEKEGLPYSDNFFDVIYSKSVIEHFYNPEIYFTEIYRILKPGGLVITLCPSWEYNYKTYFEDYSHRTPFMLQSLNDIQSIHGFENINVEFFRQLPILWKYSHLKALAEISRLIIPSKFKKYSKWIRFSKEIMLLSSANKPMLK